MGTLILTVAAGEHDRENCPVWIKIDPAQLPPAGVVLKDGAGRVLPCQRLEGEPGRLCFILPKLGRRESATFTLTAGQAPASKGVELVDRPGEKVDVTIGGDFFTSYLYSAKWVRPFLLPVAGPYGDPITRQFPVADIPGERRDHKHHKSFWVAWGRVNEVDHWSEEPGHGRQVHRAFTRIESGPVFGRIVARNDWMTPDGVKQLEEERVLTFYNVPEAGRVVDLSVTFHATEGPVEFGDTKEGGIASIRVASSMDADKAGTIVNAYGGTNEAETWGKRAHWCDYVGPVNGKTVGIAIFDTPGNFRYPTYWHVRNYGLMTANPFGLSHFLKDRSKDGSHRIARDSAFPFNYRLYFHAGDTREADVAGKFHDHVAPPAVEVKPS